MNRSETFKGAMCAAYPGDLAFSKIDARNGRAIGLIPESIPKAWSPASTLCSRQRKTSCGRHICIISYVQHISNQTYSKASGTSGRKRVTPEGFLNLEIPVPSLDGQDKLIAGFARADEMEREAARLHQSAWATFESALFTPSEPGAA